MTATEQAGLLAVGISVLMSMLTSFVAWTVYRLVNAKPPKVDGRDSCPDEPKK